MTSVDMNEPPAAVESGPESVGCLTSEQLADIATSHCTAEERARAICHFRDCRSCYDAFVTMSFTLAAMERGEAEPSRSRRMWRAVGLLVVASLLVGVVVLLLQQWQTVVP